MVFNPLPFHRFTNIIVKIGPDHMNTDKRKILHIIDSLRVGGAETLLINTIAELPEYEHVVVALNKPEDLRDQLPAGTKYYCLRFTFRKANQISTVLGLKKIVAIERPDVIHAHLYWSIIMARLARPKKIKFIFTLHGMMGSRLFRRKFSPYRLLEKFTLSSSQHMVAVSKTVYDDYVRYLPFNGVSHIIYNYVPDEFFRNVKKDFTAGEPFRVVTVGSLRSIKNQETLIRAIALLGPGYSLDIYGHGDMEMKLKRLARDINANVNFQGSQKEIYRILPGYDLFAMSSFSEGHSIALLEAMALNLPLVLSDIPSFRETTRNGALFFKVDSAEELAAKIRTMKEDEPLRKSIAENCHVLACQDVTKEKYLANIRALYDKGGTIIAT